MMTAFGELETAVEAMSAGAFWFVKKPFQNEELLALVSRALESQKVWLELRRLRHQAFADEDFLHSTSPAHAGGLRDRGAGGARRHHQRADRRARAAPARSTSRTSSTG